MESSIIFKPIKIGNVTIKNRTVFPPISTNFALESGLLTQRFVEHYERRAIGEVGLIIVENAAIDFINAKKGRFQPRIDVLDSIKEWKKLTSAVHLHNCKVSIELAHPGPVDKTVDHLKEDEIEKFIEQYANSAFIAKESGFDMVEIQGAHGLLVNLFLSPLTNHRKDAWGDFTSFAKAIRMKIAKKCGKEFPVTIRLAVEDFNGKGITLKMGKKFSQELADAGYDMIQADLGLVPKEDRLEPMRYKEGWRSYLAREIRPLKVPIVAVGMIRSLKTAITILENDADMVALGRTLIADPDWVKKVKNNNTKSIRMCIGCSECIKDRHDKDTAIHCGVNPNVGNEEGITKAQEKKKVAIIGCGPAGLEATRVSLIRGHEVYLHCEKFGGQLNMAAVPPGKEKIKWLIDYYRNILTGEMFHFINKKATKNDIFENNFDVVIIATGIKPILPFEKTNNIVDYEDILEGRTKIEGKTVVVCGGGLIGLETAEFLSEKNKVTVLEMKEDVAKDMETLTRKTLLNTLNKNNARILTNRKILKINGDTITTMNAKTFEEERYRADFFVQAFGNKPNPLMLEKNKNYVLIGDCKKVGKIVDAIHTGYSVAKDL